MTRPTEPPEKNLNDLPSILVGVSGEYFVAAELSRLGYVASVTLRNTRGIDILATNASASRSVGIQVKSLHLGQGERPCRYVAVRVLHQKGERVGTVRRGRASDRDRRSLGAAGE